MTTLAHFHQSMARQGLLLPPALVNDINRQREESLLAALASMAGLARAIHPEVDFAQADDIYAVLNGTYPLEASGIFSCEETLQHFRTIRSQRLKQLGPSEFPMPEPFSIDGITADDLNRVEAERYTLSEAHFSDGPSAEQLSLYDDVLTAAIAHARKRHPERVGAERPKTEADFPIGSPPTDMEPDLSLLPVD